MVVAGTEKTYSAGNLVNTSNVVQILPLDAGQQSDIPDCLSQHPALPAEVSSAAGRSLEPGTS